MPTRRSERGRWTAYGAGFCFALLGLAAAAAADPQPDGPQLSGELAVGGRISWGDNDAAKFREYRDLRSGLTGSFDLLLEDADVSHWLRARGENVGYRDQRYWLEGGQYGLFDVDLFYGELPHFFSRASYSSSPYVRLGGNHFELPLTDAQRDAIEAAGTIAPGDLPFEPGKLHLKWREGRAGVRYHASDSVLLRASFRVQDKEGERPFGMNFGSPGGTFINLPRYLDEQIYEVRAGSDWTLGDSALSAEYLGNFYVNNFSGVLGDNPLVSPATATTDPFQGASANYPSNWSQGLSLSGATTLPLGIPNRISANFGYSFRYQNEDFLPNTINLALGADPTLPENSLDGQVQTLLGNVNGTFKLSDNLRTSVHYRIYDFNNQTDSILFTQQVLNDTTVENTPRTSVTSDYTRQDADANLAWDFSPGWTGQLGFGWNYWDRSEDREVRSLNEYGPSLRLDHRTADGTLIHTGYEFLNREGSNYRSFAPLNAQGETDLVALNSVKFVQVRKFDEADRYVHNFDLLAKFVPTEPVELTFTGGVNYADYHDSNFGLTESLGWNVGSDLFYQISERVSVTGYYTYQWQRYWQNSRCRPSNCSFPPSPITDDPANNWDSQTQYYYHNGGITLLFNLIPDRLDSEIGYVINYGSEKTTSSSAPGGAPAGNAVDWPRMHDLLQSVGTTLSLHLSELVTLRAGYRFETYDVQNFRFNNVPSTFTDGNNVYLTKGYGDYTAHVFGMSAVLTF